MNENIMNNIIPLVVKGIIASNKYIIDFINRTITYITVKDFVLLAISLIMFIIIGYYTFKLYKKINKTEIGEIEDYDIIIIIFNIISLIIIGIFIYFKTTDLIKDFTIPEVRLYIFYKNIMIK